MAKIDQELSDLNKVSETHERGRRDETDDSLLNNEKREKAFKEEEDKYNPRKRIINYLISYATFKDLAIFAIINFSIMLYVLSLAGCHDTQTACLVNLNPEFFHAIVIYMTICSFTLSLIIFLAIQNKIKLIHILYGTVIFLYLTLIYDVGGDLAYHGSYNRVILVVFIIMGLGIISFMWFLYSLMKNKFNKTLTIIIASFVFLVVYIPYRLNKVCDKWMIGLNGEKVLNDINNDNCPIMEPQNCWVEFLDGLMDVSWYLSEDCNNFRAGEKTELMKFINKDIQTSYNYGFPITTNYSWRDESKYDVFATIIRSRYIDLENKKYMENLNPHQVPEVTLHFDKQTELGKIRMIMKRNEDLVKERRENIKKEKQPPLVNNVLVVYVDSISRPHFMRKMKRTANWIEKYMKEMQGSSSNQPHLAYQFMKYHAFKYFTPPNVNPMFYGQSMFHKNGTNIIRHFKERGFIIGQSNNICSRELYDLEDGYIEDMDWESYDHENIALMCDPNFYSPKDPYTPYMGPYSIRKRCLYGKNTFEYVLEYGELFWKTYINERKFLRVAFQDAHEGTGEVVRYLDEQLEQFLTNFEKNGWLNDTAIIFVSDHGNNMIGFYSIFNCEDFFIEKTLASLFLLTPNNDKMKLYYDNLMHNSQVMVTPYDIYNTMLNFLNIDSKNKFYSIRGNSLLEEINGKERDCKKYSIDLEEIWCRCKRTDI